MKNNGVILWTSRRIDIRIGMDERIVVVDVPAKIFKYEDSNDDINVSGMIVEAIRERLNKPDGGIGFGKSYELSATSYGYEIVANYDKYYLAKINVTFRVL